MNNINNKKTIMGIGINDTTGQTRTKSYKTWYNS